MKNIMMRNAVIKETMSAASAETFGWVSLTGLAGVLALAMSVSFTGCSSHSQTLRGDQELAVRGPKVIDAKTSPGVFELDSALNPKEPPQVLANVKDMSAKVSNVKLRLNSVALELPMENVEGTTWRATLTPEQLKRLAVNGKTLQYDASVIATNEWGDTAISAQPIQISVKAPEASIH